MVGLGVQSLTFSELSGWSKICFSELGAHSKSPSPRKMCYCRVRSKCTQFNVDACVFYVHVIRALYKFIITSDDDDDTQWRI